MGKYFKGKSINYHTSVTVSKKEGIIIWITALVFIALFIANMIFIKNVFFIVLIDFVEFAVMFGIYMAIIFSPKHKEEREKNTKIGGI